MLAVAFTILAATLLNLGEAGVPLVDAIPQGLPLSALVAERPALKHVVLMCSAVNAIDASALESLEEINHRLRDADITLHLSEVKGPVMDRLKRSPFSMI